MSMQSTASLCFNLPAYRWLFAAPLLEVEGNEANTAPESGETVSAHSKPGCEASREAGFCESAKMHILSDNVINAPAACDHAYIAA